MLLHPGTYIKRYHNDQQIRFQSKYIYIETLKRCKFMSFYLIYNPNRELINATCLPNNVGLDMIMNLMGDNAHIRVGFWHKRWTVDCECRLQGVGTVNCMGRVHLMEC